MQKLLNNVIAEMAQVGLAKKNACQDVNRAFEFMTSFPAFDYTRREGVGWEWYGVRMDILSTVLFVFYRDKNKINSEFLSPKFPRMS